MKMKVLRKVISLSMLFLSTVYLYDGRHMIGVTAGNAMRERERKRERGFPHNPHIS